MTVTAPAVTGTPQAFNFTTSGTVVTYTGGGTASATTYDILCVNSDNVVTTPSGWSQARSEVTNQGAYIFYKSGGTTSATLALGGGVASNTSALWLRITNATALDAATGAQFNSIGGSATPSATTATLTETTELVVAFSASHNFSTVPAAGAWSSGYTEQVTGSSVSGGTNTWAFGSIGVKVPAGTAAESPSYTWSAGTQAQNRYLLIATFTGFDAAASAAPNGVAVSVGLGSHTVSLNRTGAPNGLTATVALGQPTGALNLSAAPSGIAVTVSPGSPSVLGAPAVPNGIAVSVGLGSHTVSLNRTASPSGLAAAVSLGSPSVVQSSAPSGISVSVSPGSPAVSATVLTAGNPGSWWGLSSVNEENAIYLRQEVEVTRPFCPNDGETLLLNPRTRRFQCPYDGFTR